MAASSTFDRKAEVDTLKGTAARVVIFVFRRFLALLIIPNVCDCYFAKGVGESKQDSPNASSEPHHLASTFTTTSRRPRPQ
jgi:hypothetical protein